MRLTTEERDMLSGKGGRASKKCMEILVALGEIYGAKRLVPVSSVQVSGVSYKNLGDAGIEFLRELAEDGRARVKTTLNPAGMDLTNWALQGIDSGFASGRSLSSDPSEDAQGMLEAMDHRSPCDSKSGALAEAPWNPSTNRGSPIA